MKRTIWKQPWLAALLVALVAAACGDQGGPVEPRLSSEQANFTASPRQGSGTKVSGLMPQFAVSGWIGPEGGELSDGSGKYTLTVPDSAVSEPTFFTFESSSTEYIQVHLTATSEGGATNDVGSAGFAAPVRLTLSFEAAGGAPKWLKYVIAWVRPDGVLEQVPSSINVVQKTVTGKLGHFSDYALIVP